MYVVHTPPISTYIAPQVHTERHTFLKEENSVHYCIYRLFYYVHNVKKIAVNRHSTGVRQQLCSQRMLRRPAQVGDSMCLCPPVLHPTQQMHTPVQAGEATEDPKPPFLSL